MFSWRRAELFGQFGARVRKIVLFSATLTVTVRLVLTVSYVKGGLAQVGEGFSRANRMV